MKKIFQIILIICGGLLMNSCYYDEIEDVIVEDAPEITDTVYFAADIQPIFKANCVDCHTASNKLDLTEGNSYLELVPAYVNAGDAASSKLYNYLPGKDHPVQTPSSSEPDANERALIKAWIDQGAINN